MKNTCSTPSSSPSARSGFSILFHSTAARFIGRLWNRANDFCRPLLPLLHLFMLAVTAVILCGVVFANGHTPCWYDEICMLDPAYHRVAEGVWRSIAQWDSIDVVPFAPNYPLLINILRLLIAVFGVNFRILRGSMLVFGLVPVAALLWLFRRKGLLQSCGEVIQGAFFTACFTFFHWAVYIRPESVLLSVVTLLVFAWAFNRPVLVFLSALLVPLCGLQWNVLLLPAFLHWLVFGGRLRNPILVAAAFVLSTAGTIIAYHALGMWPSYLQEAARVGGTSTFANVLGKLHGIVASWDVGCLLNPTSFPPVPVIFCGLFLAIGTLVPSGRGTRRILAFVFLHLSVVSAVLLLVHMDRHYFRPVLLPFSILVPVFLRPWRDCRPIAVLIVGLAALYVAHANASKALGNFQLGADFAGDIRWIDEDASLRSLLKPCTPDGIVVAPNSAWFAVRTQGRDYLPLCYAFDISEAHQRTVAAVLVEDIPQSPHHFDCSLFRHTSYTETMMPLFCPSGTNLDAVSVSPDDFMDAIASHWHCTFTEIPLDQPDWPGFIRYRLFHPVFPGQGGHDTK